MKLEAIKELEMKLSQQDLMNVRVQTLRECNCDEVLVNDLPHLVGRMMIIYKTNLKIKIGIGPRDRYYEFR